MSKKQTLLFKFSIGLNILLIVFAAWGYVHINRVKEQILITEVQHNLVELEGLIANQKDNNWSEPNLVTTELGDVLNGISLGISTDGQLGIPSKNDKKILNNLLYKLRQFPNDELYKFAELTKEDKDNFENLQKILREVGLGLNITVSGDMKYFIKQAQELAAKIEVPLK
ncbi:hypothetical protein EHS13_02540 [Paenibacillus psychroresistens]|uniref:Uncharacterized protein n=1 Tax=Paenibacillus psychroresistens TaxID=1778678 RepID=A0A6B8RB70_9BACL|nr:hypothetical protein [Paenibacillus psychroresistens]QGQ93861.1 hypothetical protein EHS13_02540 [Paenibacillus psychroresistens]